MTNGRGAWSLHGKDNGVVYYQVVPGMPLDGSTPGKGSDYQAVNLGVRAIQTRLNQYIKSYADQAPGPLDVDGVFGPKSGSVAAWVTKMLGLPASSPPRVGATLTRAIWHNMVKTPAAKHHVSAAWIWGIMLHESSADPAAVGYFNPDDYGLMQINGPSHPAVTLEQAFTPAFAFEFAAGYLDGYQSLFAARGPELMRDCTIASWNSPAKAEEWYRDGAPPDSQIYNYVTKVTLLAGSW